MKAGAGGAVRSGRAEEERSPCMTKDEQERYYNRKADRDIQHISIYTKLLFARLEMAQRIREERSRGYGLG